MSLKQAAYEEHMDAFAARIADVCEGERTDDVCYACAAIICTALHIDGRAQAKKEKLFNNVLEFMHQMMQRIDRDTLQ